MAASREDLYTLVHIELGELAEDLQQEEINRSIDKAMVELGYSYPITGLSEMWAINRSKRHAIEILLLTESPSFKYNKLELQQAFEHLKTLVLYYDETFTSALETSPELFPNATWANNPASALGVYITNGFDYDATGRDISFLGLKTKYTPDES